MKLSKKQKEKMPDGIEVVNRLNTLNEIELIKMRLFTERLDEQLTFFKNETYSSKNESKQNDVTQK